MSRAKVHKNRLLRFMTSLREEVSKCVEEKHIEHPYTELNQVELDIHDLTREIERKELAK